jgi:hypothetical protein
VGVRSRSAGCVVNVRIKRERQSTHYRTDVANNWIFGTIVGRPSTIEISFFDLVDVCLILPLLAFVSYRGSDSPRQTVLILYGRVGLAPSSGSPVLLSSIVPAAWAPPTSNLLRQSKCPSCSKCGDMPSICKIWSTVLCVFQKVQLFRAEMIICPWENEILGFL